MKKFAQITTTTTTTKITKLTHFKFFLAIDLKLFKANKLNLYLSLFFVQARLLLIFRDVIIFNFHLKNLKEKDIQ
jgi:hypothetical protein